MTKNIILCAALLVSSLTGFSQSQLNDSFLDSLVTYFDQSESPRHFLSVRAKYTNRALFAGRDFGTTQSLVMPSVSYWHKSGFYADFTGYLYSQSTPKYQFSNVSLGYMGSLNSQFMFSLEYGRSFAASKDISTALANSISVQGNFTHHKLSASLSYSYYFDNTQTSSLLVPSVGLNFSTKKIGFIDKITIQPNLNAMFGNTNSFLNTYSFTVPTASDSSGTPTWGSGPPPWVKADSSQIGQRPSWVTSGGRPQWGSGNPYLTTSQSTFGLLSVGLSVPVVIKVKQTTVTFTPNLTKAFASNMYEQVIAKPQFNFSIGLSHSFGWK
ncbi:MAG: hypothetical protein U0Y10_23120 [Spirosomataceae bacterium]